jgi:TPR repeat protein
MGFWYRTTVKKYPSIGELQLIAEETDIYPDNRIAYMWYTLSDSNGNPDALRIRGYTVRDMTTDEITQAEQMVRDWKPGDCPSAEHRLGLPDVQSLAEQDDMKAAIESERQMTSDAWKWLCMIANSGHGEAQRSVGNWHRTLTWQSRGERLEWLRDEVGIQPDNRAAYMWFTLADANGNLSALSQREGSLKADMNPEEIGQAEQMVRDWKPGDCPSAEHRLGT